MSLLFDKIFSSVALGHLVVDILNGSRTVILTFMSISLGLTNTALGIFSTIYVVVGSLTQPVFGYLGDRLGPRWLSAGGVIWMGAFFSLAMFEPGQWALVFLVLGSLGSAAFHPAGTVEATLRGRTHFAGRETTSAAYFFVFGQAGHFLGPVIGGPLLERFGTLGLLFFTSLTLPVGMNAARQLRPSCAIDLSLPASDEIDTPRSANRPGAYLFRPKWLPFLLLAFLAFFQAWAQQNMITFVPKYLSDMGQSASTYGLVASLFMGGSAFGNVLGGSMADRLGKRRVTMATLALASIPLYLVSRVGWSPWLYLLVPLSGALTGATHSIIVVSAQRMIPGGMALASGMILGFMFSSGAMGTMLTGYLADSWGLTPIFQLTAGITLIAGLFGASMQKD